MSNPGHPYNPQQYSYQPGLNQQQYQKMPVRMNPPMQGQPPQGPPQQNQRMQHYPGQYPSQQQQQQHQQQMGSVHMRPRAPPPQHMQQQHVQQQPQQHMGPPGQSPQMHPPQQQQFNAPKPELSPVVKNSKVPDDPVLQRSVNNVREPEFEKMFANRYNDSSMEQKKISNEVVCLYPMPGSNQRNDNRNRGRTDYKKGRKNENYK